MRTKFSPAASGTTRLQQFEIGRQCLLVCVKSIMIRRIARHVDTVHAPYFKSEEFKWAGTKLALWLVRPSLHVVERLRGYGDSGSSREENSSSIRRRVQD